MSISERAARRVDRAVIWRCKATRFERRRFAPPIYSLRNNGTTEQRNSETAKQRNIPRRAFMTYVDGFVVAVLTEDREAYRRFAELAAVVFKENGALRVVECWGDDVPEGKLTSFPMAVKRKDDETVVFSWVVWPSRQVRDKGMEAVMADPRVQADMNPMPFDGKRMIYGGFEVIVDV
jgi:uncharacterized protein YbaA (DUF1428 family)